VLTYISLLQANYLYVMNATLPVHDPRRSGTEPLWTVEDVAEYLRLGAETVRMMARRGELPAFKVGRVWRFKIHDVKYHIKSRIEASLEKG